MSYVSTDIKKIIAEIIENKKEKGGVKNIYFVGCGGSLGALYPAKTFMEREAQVLRSAWINSNEFVHSTPKDFGENSIICLAYHVGTDGKKYYYTYHVSEMKVDGYTTEITYKGDRQYSITVTNTKNWFDSLLPETGGMGKALLYTLGVLLLCLVTATEYRKRKSTRSQSSYK